MPGGSIARPHPNANPTPYPNPNRQRHGPRREHQNQHGPARNSSSLSSAIPQAAYIAAYEAQLVYDRPELARELGGVPGRASGSASAFASASASAAASAAGGGSSIRRGTLGLVRWSGRVERDDLGDDDRFTLGAREGLGGGNEGRKGEKRGAREEGEGEEGAEDEVWLDRYDVLHLLDTIPGTPSQLVPPRNLLAPTPPSQRPPPPPPSAPPPSAPPLSVSPLPASVEPVQAPERAPPSAPFSSDSHSHSHSHSRSRSRSSSSSPSSPRPSSSSTSSSSGWTELPSDQEDTFYISDDEALERMRGEKRRGWVDKLRAERVRQREREEREEGERGEEAATARADEEPPPPILTLMQHTAGSLLASPNPRILELRIMTHHAADERFSFLRGRFPLAWERVKAEARAEKARKEEPERRLKEQGAVGGLVGAYDSDSDSDDGQTRVIANEPGNGRETEDGTGIEARAATGKDDGHPRTSPPPLPLPDETVPTDAAEEKKRMRRLKAEEWKRKRALAGGIDDRAAAV